MKKCKLGAVRMALDAGVPILPVTIRGGERVWPNTLRLPRIGHRVEIIYHPVMQVAQGEDEAVRELARRETERLAQIIQSAL
jgi:1-acyl-sn-glycerol-3-phosphate acyltransferase